MTRKPNISADSPHPAAPYTKIAAVYDKMMLHVNYPRWAVYIDALLRREKLPDDALMLDIGCGTGRFLKEMYKLGYHGDGCEPSPDMLALARNRLPWATFYQTKLPELANIPANRYAIMTCLYDTINYIMDAATLAQALNAVYERLPAGGVFMFDVVTRQNCLHYFQHYQDSEVLDSTTAYYRESFFDEKTSIQYNWIRVHLPEGVFQEVHRQYIFKLSTIKDIITSHTNFELAHCYDEFTIHKANKRSGRAHFVLRKAASEYR